MLGYRNSYRRTVATALLASSLAAIAAIALLITPSAVFRLRLATELLSLVCLAIAVPRGSSRGWRDHCSPSRRGGTEGPAILFRPTTGMLPWYIDSPAAPVANVTSWLTGSIAAVAGGMGEGWDVCLVARRISHASEFSSVAAVTPGCSEEQVRYLLLRKRPVTILVRDQRYGQRPPNGERRVVKSYTTCSAWCVVC
jgi:hypothetical protein